MRLQQKIAIVTGGGQGMGRAIALALAREGADVVIYDMNLDRAKNAVAEVKSLGRQALAIKCDVSNSEEVRQATKQVLDKFHKIDILVNNVGVTKKCPPEELTEDIWDQTINTNLKGTFLCSQAVGKIMIKQKHGKIINIASLSGHFGGTDRAAYCASKGGVILLSKSLAADWAKYNINVNVVSPGHTETPRVLGADPSIYTERMRRIPLQRANRPEDIAGVVVFLASSEADNITGQDIVIDGGISAVHPGWPSPIVSQA
jgi:NAD(P)-dependent dehydrogenase (short-subunit alcohol dehydrogenase family)